LKFNQGLAMNTLIQNIQQLGSQEKLQLVEDLWDSLETESVPPISDSCFEELHRRLAYSQSHPDSAVSIQDIAHQLGVRL
jgi:putative addiction module component (TIGR02574 family)